MLRWQLQLGVVPLPKANKHDHLASNLDIFDFHISDDHLVAAFEETKALFHRWALTVGRRSCGKRVRRWFARLERG